MKRRREKKETEIKEAIEELSLLQHHPKLVDDHTVSSIPARPFLSLCNLVLQFLDKIGPAMSVLRQDVSHNIQRLELRLDSEPKRISNMIEILKQEADEGIARKRDSCSRAILWLTRSLDLMVALLERVAKDPSQSMEKIVEDSYSLTLKPWHGWISFAAYKVALKLLPDNKVFIDVLIGKGENSSTLKEEIQSLIALLVPLLDDIHFVMVR
ncbi:hypothetical protein V2J09_008751 [Rumex salicifolius]